VVLISGYHRQRPWINALYVALDPARDPGLSFVGALLTTIYLWSVPLISLSCLADDFEDRKG
jgi:hypothetical protein